MMTNLLNGAHVATNHQLTSLATSFAKRLAIVLTLLLTIGVGNAWGEEYNFNNIPTKDWSTSGGNQTINGKSWSYSSSTYISGANSRIQVGSKNNPQNSNWTIQTPISSFGTNIRVTKVSITAYTTATTATYDISVGGSSVKSGSLTTSSATYSGTLSATTGNIVVTLKGSDSSKAMYLYNISVTYETISATTYAVTYDLNGGTGTTPTQANVAAGSTFTLAASSGFTKSGYNFAGWNDGTTTYSAGTTYTMPSNAVTFTAQWTEIPKYTITLKDDESTITQSSAGASITLPSREGCKGYNFEGWTKSWTEEQSSWTTTAPTIIPAGDYTPTTNENLYPVYTKTEGGGGTPTTINLTNSQIQNGRNGSNNYATNYNIEGWTGKYAVSLSNSNYSMQIGRNTDSSKGAYNSHITTPSTAGAITSITITPHTGWTTAEGRTFYLMNTDELGYTAPSNQVGTYGSGVCATKNGTVTIDVTGSPTQFHIYADGVAYIHSISITYLASGGSTISYISVPQCTTETSRYVTPKYRGDSGGT